MDITTEPFGHRLLHHPADKRLDIHGFALHPVGAVGPVVGRHPLAVLAIKAPDSDRRAHDVCGHVARSALILRGNAALLHVGHQAVRLLVKTRLHQLVSRLGLERLAQQRQQVPLPLTAQQLIGEITPMLPAFSRRVIAPAGGNPMQVRMVLPIATRRVEHGHGATPERLVPDGTREIVQALAPAAPPRAQ